MRLGPRAGRDAVRDHACCGPRACGAGPGVSRCRRRARYAQNPELPGTAVAGEARGRDGRPRHPNNERAAYISADAGPERPHRCDLLCRGEFDLFLASRARTDGPRPVSYTHLTLPTKRIV